MLGCRLSLPDTLSYLTTRTLKVRPPRSTNQSRRFASWAWLHSTASPEPQNLKSISCISQSASARSCCVMSHEEKIRQDSRVPSLLTLLLSLPPLSSDLELGCDTTCLLCTWSKTAVCFRTAVVLIASSYISAAKLIGCIDACTRHGVSGEL